MSGARESEHNSGVHVSREHRALISSHPQPYFFMYRQEFIKLSFILIDFRQFVPRADPEENFHFYVT